jgi:hypothetical protein
MGMSFEGIGKSILLAYTDDRRTRIVLSLKFKLSLLVYLFNILAKLIDNFT